MRRVLIALASCVFVLSLATASYGEIGWAGNIWPVHGNTVADNADVNVYFQIWKDGVTGDTGQGAGISATLYYGPQTGPYTPVEMTFNTDVGNNDEYIAAIPSSALSGNSEIWFYCEAYDSTDASTYSGAKDQNGNDPPFKLNITEVLDQDVTVWFTLCFPPDVDPGGDVCITGDHAELTNWGDGVVMSQPCPESSPKFFQVSVTFAAGSNPYVEYKYRKDNCGTWESTGNHTINIDDSNSTYIIPNIDHWEYYDGEDCPPCGVGTDDPSWGNIKSLYE